MTKVAILIDGGYFLKRLPAVFPKAYLKNPDSVALAMRKLVLSHLRTQNKIVRA